LDIREILRRLQLGERERRIAHDLRVSRKTVAKYREWAEQHGVLPGELPSAADLQRLLANTLAVVPPPETPSKANHLRDKIAELRRKNVECRAIHQILKEQHEFEGSYSSVYRLVRRIEPHTPEACVRVEVGPGEEAQVDFGYAGRLLDPVFGTLRKAWVFVMTLSFSRHQYAELVFDQEVATWLRCHRHAFEWFAGVPRRVVIDNLKSAILRAAVHDPVVQRAYRECAEHYGFLIAPCRPRTPQHKGKVEQGGVHYVKRNALAGREFRDIHEGNEHLLAWCTEVAGQRIHGTVKEKPLERFELERPALLPLPTAPYALAVWKKLKLHPDCHVVFEEAFYSAPYRLVGKTLWLRAADRSVMVFHEHELVATHERAVRRGQRRTNNDHLPPTKLAGLLTTPAYCLRRANEIGPHTSELIGRLLGERPVDRLRTAQGILRLAHKYSPRRLEAACARALLFDETSCGAIKRILDRALDAVVVPSSAAPVEQPSLFARPWTDFFDIPREVPDATQPSARA